MPETILYLTSRDADLLREWLKSRTPMQRGTSTSIMRTLLRHGLERVSPGDSVAVTISEYPYVGLCLPRCIWGDHEWARARR